MKVQSGSCRVHSPSAHWAAAAVILAALFGALNTHAHGQPPATDPTVVNIDSLEKQRLRREDIDRRLDRLASPENSMLDVVLKMGADSYYAILFAVTISNEDLFDSDEQLLAELKNGIKKYELTPQRQTAFWIGSLSVDFYNKAITNRSRVERIKYALAASAGDAILYRRLYDAMWGYCVRYIDDSSARAIAEAAKAHSDPDVRASVMTSEPSLSLAPDTIEAFKKQFKEAYALAVNPQVKAKIAASRIKVEFGLNQQPGLAGIEQCLKIRKELKLADDITLGDEGSIELANVLNSFRVAAKIERDAASREIERILNVLPQEDPRRADFLFSRALLPGRGVEAAMLDFYTSTLTGEPVGRIQRIRIFVRQLQMPEARDSGFRESFMQMSSRFMDVHRDSKPNQAENSVKVSYALIRAEVLWQSGQREEAIAAARDACVMAQGDANVYYLAILYHRDLHTKPN